MTITIFNKEIPLYGLLFFVGIIVAATVALFLIKKRKIDTFDFACAAIYMMIGVIVGAKLLFLLVSVDYIQEIAKHNSFGDTLQAIIKGGFVFYGGLLGGILGLFIYGKQFKTKMTDYYDVIATVLPLGHAFGRVGCFFAGCCYGMEYDGFLSHTYEHATGTTTPIGVPLLPIQLIEAALLLISFGVMLTIFLKTEKKGFCAMFYACLYAVIRFVLEFFRGDKERGGFLLSTSQWVSVGIISFVVALIIYQRKKSKKTILSTDESVKNDDATEVTESVEAPENEA